MLWVLLGVSAAVMLATIVTAVVAAKKKAKYRKIYTAAGNILREDYLNYALQNHTLDGSAEQPRGAKLMICLTTVQNKKRISYVFDPEKQILIGRDADNSNIFIDNVAVSQKHCRIYAQDNRVIFEDLYSKNGSILKRGWTKRYTLVNGQRVVLQSGDVLFIGNSELKVMIFVYDITAM